MFVRYVYSSCILPLMIFSSAKHMYPSIFLVQLWVNSCAGGLSSSCWVTGLEEEEINSKPEECCSVFFCFQLTRKAWLVLHKPSLPYTHHLCKQSSLGPHMFRSTGVSPFFFSSCACNRIAFPSIILISIKSCRK